jgi:hypothetical protein
MKVGRVVAGMLAVALGTWLVGWTAPAIWGALAGLMWPRWRPASAAALSAAAGWDLLLIVSMLRGDPVGMLATRLAVSMQIPTAALVAATLVFPVLLAASVAWLTALLRRGVRGLEPGDAKSPGAIMRQAA